MHEVEVAGQRQPSVLTTSTDHPGEVNFVTDADDDDDDEQDNSSRKFSLEGDFLSTFYHAFISSHAGTGHERQLPLCCDQSSNLTCKYIVYRNLRI